MPESKNESSDPLKTITQALSPKHLEMLVNESAIAPEVVAARGYKTVTTKAKLRELGFGQRQQNVPALLIPLFGPSGTISSYQLRPDQPRINDKGKSVKYETPGGSRMVFDVHPSIRYMIGDPNAPLFVTEGAKKADALVSKGCCTVGLIGVWNWRGKNDQGGKTVLAEWEFVALYERLVYIVFDSDVVEKRSVHEAMRRLKAWLESRGAKVRIIYLAAADAAKKQGVDDYLASGRSIDDLLALASAELKPPPNANEDDKRELKVAQYAIKGGVVCHIKEQRTEGEGWTSEYKPLCNFKALITGERTKDDGVERQTVFVLEGELESGRKLPQIEVRAAQFANMSWVSSEWGARAVVNAGIGAKDHLRAGLQLLSGDFPSLNTFTHMGWRELAGTYVYLHAGGAIGAPGKELPETLHVELEPKLALFCLPEPPQGENLIRAVRASFRYLDLAPCPLTATILGAVYRAPLESTTFSLHLSGLTGAGKSVLSVLAQQHYGVGLDEKHIPASWGSTDNALEGTAFAAKDALLLIDDYKLEGSLADQQRLDGKAARIFRAQGNLTGRGRMKADGTLRPNKPPRGLILSTGEDVPSGHSIRARNIFLNITPTDTDWTRVSAAQQDACEGLYAEALAAFIAWLAIDFPARKEFFAQLHKRYRNDLQSRAAHKRTADAGGQLLATWHMVLDFAVESNVLTQEDRVRYWQLVETALLTTLNMQHDAQIGADPVTHFRELLTDALASQRCHVAAVDGSYPGASLGWLRVRDQSDYGESLEKYVPKGDRIGWVDNSHFYLLPSATFAVLHDMSRRQNTSLGVTPQTLWKRLDEAGLIALRDGRHLTIKRSFEGDERVRVLCIPRNAVRNSGESGAADSEIFSRRQYDAPRFSDLGGKGARVDTGTGTMLQTNVTSRAPQAPHPTVIRDDAARRGALTWEEL